MPMPPIQKQLLEQRLTAFCERRIPPHVRDQIRLFYRFRADTATLFESRPYWKNPNHWIDMPIAQIRYDRQKGHFSLYCADCNDKWHRYDPFESTTDIDAILQEIDEDPTGIFWG